MNTSNWYKLRTGALDCTIFHIRAKILQTIRHFFYSKDFLEIEPPLLTPYPTLDSHIQSITSTLHYPSNKSMHYFLHTSPEHAMKKLLASGIERIFFLGKVFRDKELGRQHNPEFTLLEWYRTHADYSDIQNDTEELIRFVSQKLFSTETLSYQGKTIDFSKPWGKVTVRDMFLRATNIDLNNPVSTDRLQHTADEKGIYFDQSDDWDTLFYRLFLELVEPDLGHPKPVFIQDYPNHMAQMAKLKADDNRWAERTELYIGGVELANGYSELLNSAEQEKRFLSAQTKKQRSNQTTYPIDYGLIDALKMPIPPSAGMALGVDRLIMLFLNKDDIRDVILFPQHDWVESNERR